MSTWQVTLLNALQDKWVMWMEVFCVRWRQADHAKWWGLRKFKRMLLSWEESRMRICHQFSLSLRIFRIRWIIFHVSGTMLATKKNLTFTWSILTTIIIAATKDFAFLGEGIYACCIHCCHMMWAARVSCDTWRCRIMRVLNPQDKN